MASSSSSSSPRKRGAFIVLEGIDRCGKSTTTSRLLHFLQEEEKHPTILMRFPDRSTAIGQKIDAYLQSKCEIDDKKLHEMFCENRWEFAPQILQHLEEGKVVVADRYAFSGVSYSVAKGMELQWCLEGDKDLPAPDLIIYLDIEPEVAAKRGEYGKERYERLEFQTKVREAYEKLMALQTSLGTSHWVRFNAAQQPDPLFLEIKETVRKTILELDNKPIQKLW